MNRRKFIISNFLLLSTYSMSSTKMNTIVFEVNEWNIISTVLSYLFPQTNKYNLQKFNPSNYIFEASRSQYFDKNDLDVILNGAKWLDEKSQNKYQQNFKSLSSKFQNKLIDEISSLRWGESWLSYLLTYTFEALLSDPIYDGNIDEIGWKFIGHSAGTPRPIKRYGK